MFMIFFVLDDPDRLDEILERWEQVGIRGATIIESTGIHRMRRKLIPMRYTFFTGREEEGHITLFVIVEDRAAVESALAACEAIVGNLDLPNTGVFAAWPLALVKGLPVPGAEE